MLQVRFRQIDRDEVDDAAQQREHEEDQQPVHLLTAAYGVDGEKDRDKNVQAAESEKGHGSGSRRNR